MMNRKSIFFVTVLVLAFLAIALVACSGKEEGPTVVQVKLGEYSIIMDQDSIPAGEVRFEIVNDGTELHEVVLEPAGAQDEPFEVNGEASEAEDIDPGAKATIEWTLDQPGDYQLACYVTNEGDSEDHATKGMITEFTVTQP